jgi:hypothetical protein
LPPNIFSARPLEVTFTRVQENPHPDISLQINRVILTT